MSNIVICDFDGCFPNLCSGKFAVVYNGVTLYFEPHSLHSTGGLDNDYVAYKGVWEIFEENWPVGCHPEWREEILEAINEQIPHGCCGGCA